MRKLAYIIYCVLVTVAVVVLAVNLFGDDPILLNRIKFDRTAFWGFTLFFLIFGQISSIFKEVIVFRSERRVARWLPFLVDFLVLLSMFAIVKLLAGPRVHTHSSNAGASFAAGACAGIGLSSGILPFLAGIAFVARGLLIGHWPQVGAGLVVIGLAVIRVMLAKKNQPEEEQVWQPGQSLDLNSDYREIMLKASTKLDMQPGHYDVILETSGRNDVKTAKTLTDLFEVGLADAKKLVASVPQLLVYKADAAEAAGIKMLLRSTEAEVKLEPVVDASIE